MNKGIKDYFKMISNSISNDTTTLVNINSKYANFHIIINLYKSDEVRSIPLSLVYTLTENVTNTGFGNGFKLNFYNKIIVDKNITNNSIYEEKFDGSLYEYNKILNSDYYENNELHTIIHDCWDDLMKDDSWIYLTDKQSNKYTYDYHFLSYPYKIEMSNGSVYNFVSDLSKIYEINNGNNEKIFFQYILNKTIIKIERYNQEIYRIELEYDSDNNIKNIKKFKGTTLITHTNYEFSFDEGNKFIKIIDMKTSHKVVYQLDNQNKVDNIIGGYSDNLINSSRLKINYFDNYSEVIDSLNNYNMFFFDNDGKLAYSVNKESLVESYEYNENKELVIKSNKICNDREYILNNESNLLTNGFFIYKTYGWTSAGNGNMESITDNSNPIISLGDKVLKTHCVGNEYVITQSVNIQGNPNEQLTFVAWGKKNYNNNIDCDVYVKVILSYKNNIILTKTNRFDTTLNIWQYKTIGIKSESTYDNVKIELTLKGENVEFLFSGFQLYKMDNGLSRTFDLNGNVVKYTDGISAYNSEYNDRNLLTFNSGYNNEAMNYIYDDNNNPIYVSLPYGGKIIRNYDSYNRLTNEKTYFNDKFMENKKEYDLETNIENTKKNVSYNYCGIPTEIYFNKLYNTITKIKYPLNVEKEFSYDEYNNLTKMIVSCNDNSLSIEYRYNEKNLLEKILLPGFNYKIIYDQENRPIEIIYGQNQNSISLVKVNYLLKKVGINEINTNLIASEEYGKNGDVYFFEYNSQNKLSSISLMAKQSNTKTLLYSFEYNKYGKIIKITNNQNTPILETYYKYDSNGNIVSLYDNENNYVNYLYSLDNMINTKVYKNSNIVNAISMNSVDKSRGITPETLAETLKRNGEYVCFFNYVEKHDDQFLVSKKLMKIISNNLQKNIIQDISPTKGNELLPIIDDGIGCIEYLNLSQERLQYLINIYGGFEYPNGSISFWFKIDEYQNDKCLLCLGDDKTKNQVYVIFEDNSLALYATDFNGVNYRLIFDVGIIKLGEWNYFGLSIYNRNDGYNYDNVCKYIIQLNENQKEYKKVNPRLVVDMENNCPMAIGCKLEDNLQKFKMNGLISSIVFGEGKNDNDYLDSCYKIGNEYIFKNIYTDKNSKTFYSSSVNKYDLYDKTMNLFEKIKIFPLHNSLNSLTNDLPYEYSKRSSLVLNIDEQFEYDEQIKRNVYIGDGQKLIYDVYSTEDLNNGVITLKFKMKKNNSTNYIFQCKDQNNNTLGIYREKSDNKLYLEICEKKIDIGFVVDDLDWHFLGVTWSKITVSGSLTTYAYSVSILLDNSFVERSCSVDFTFSNLKVSIARNFEINDEKVYPLYGNVEMLMIGNIYASSTTLKLLYRKSIVLTLSKHYNNFGLLELYTYTVDKADLLRIQYEYATNNNKVSTLISKMIINNGYGSSAFEYEYDICDRLIKVKKLNLIDKLYEYNYLNYLTREEHPQINKTYVYDYDDLGNMISRKEYSSTSNLLVKESKFSYSLEYPTLIIKCNDKNIEYNDTLFGNPTLYGTEDNNFVYKWNGKKLVRIINNAENIDISYEYNEKGNRIKKIINGVETKFFYEGKNLIYEKNSNYEKFYYYDESDILFGFGIKEGNWIDKYYYVRDINGVIIGLLDEVGNFAVEYEYDSYGNILSITSDYGEISGLKNNILYKGYYYDFETKMYYLKSRYYVPEWCRYLNSDDPRMLAFYSELTINRNLFIYCNNDPIQNTDENGQSVKKFLQKVWSFVKKLSPIEVTKSFTVKLDSENGYVSAKQTKKYIGSSWSLISIDIGKDTNGDTSWNVGVGGSLSFNFGSDGVSLKGKLKLNKKEIESSCGLSFNGKVFLEFGENYEITNDDTITYICGTEIDVDWGKLAQECKKALIEYNVARIIVGVIATVTVMSGGTAAAAGFATAAVLIAMIEKEDDDKGENIL